MITFMFRLHYPLLLCWFLVGFLFDIVDEAETLECLQTTLCYNPENFNL
jgi:hypothetical protein